MSRLGTILEALEVKIKTVIPTANVYWAIEEEKNDSTPMPLFEITFSTKESDSFNSSEMNRTKISVLYHSRTTLDKKSIEGLKEKLDLETQIRNIISDWETEISVGPITNIYTDHLVTFTSGEFGSLNKKIISIGIDFTISYWEA